MTEYRFRAENGSRPTPQLLVSVRSASEASLAATGGCQILDVKEPSRGSLGKADDAVIDHVLQVGLAAGIPVSAAMGEVTDYSTSQTGHDLEQRIPDSLLNLSFTKLGLAGLQHEANWSSRWYDTMSMLTDFRHQQVDGYRKWVAVIYADWQRAAAPSPEAIIDSILNSSFSTSLRIDGVLVDTWSKASGRLLDSLDVEQLRSLAAAVQQSGRFFAVAGRLTLSVLSDLVSVRPDIVAIRSAACRNENRTSAVDESSVREFRKGIERVFPVASARNESSIGAIHEQC